MAQKLDFPDAYKAGYAQARADVRTGDIGPKITGLLGELLAMEQRNFKLQQVVEITEIHRDANLEARRVEKRVVSETQRKADEISGYLTYLAGWVKSARDLGVDDSSK
jgi:hypothetical protein